MGNRLPVSKACCGAGETTAMNDTDRCKIYEWRTKIGALKSKGFPGAQMMCTLMEGAPPEMGGADSHEV